MIRALLLEALARVLARLEERTRRGRERKAARERRRREAIGEEIRRIYNAPTGRARRWWR